MVRLSGPLTDFETTKQELSATEPSEIFGPMVALLTMRFTSNKLENIGIAREKVATYLRFVGGISDDRIDDAKLCTSEVVTDAIKYGGPDGLTHINIFTTLGEFVITVGSGKSKDGSLPQINDTVSDEAESGRGLILVQHYSDQMGFAVMNPSIAPDRTAVETWFVIKRDGPTQTNMVPAQAMDTPG